MAKGRIALLIAASCILWPLAANTQREPHPPCETSSPFPKFAPPGLRPITASGVAISSPPQLSALPRVAADIPGGGSYHGRDRDSRGFADFDAEP
jgi:hypothetical protein